MVSGMLMCGSVRARLKQARLESNGDISDCKSELAHDNACEECTFEFEHLLWLGNRRGNVRASLEFREVLSIRDAKWRVGVSGRFDASESSFDFLLVVLSSACVTSIRGNWVARVVLLR